MVCGVAGFCCTCVQVLEKTKKTEGASGVSRSDLAKSTYCTQVMKENLRFIPPAQPFKMASPTDRETSLRRSKVPAGGSLHVMGA